MTQCRSRWRSTGSFWQTWGDSPGDYGIHNGFVKAT